MQGGKPKKEYHWGIKVLKIGCLYHITSRILSINLSLGVAKVKEDFLKGDCLLEVKMPHY